VKSLRDAAIRLMSLNRTQGVQDDEYEQAEIDLEQAIVNSGWLPISQAPKDGRTYLLWDSDGHPYLGGYSPTEGSWWSDDGESPLHPTHFMYLPEPPKE
jgi:hypothetical protein